MDPATLAATVVSGATRPLLLGDTDWTLRFWVLGLVGLLLLSAAVVGIVARWRKGGTRLGPTPDEELAHFRELYERGEISKEEYQRVREILGGRIRARLGMVKHPEVTPPPAHPGSNEIRPDDPR